MHPNASAQNVLAVSIISVVRRLGSFRLRKANNVHFIVGESSQENHLPSGRLQAQNRNTDSEGSGPGHSLNPSRIPTSATVIPSRCWTAQDALYRFIVMVLARVVECTNYSLSILDSCFIVSISDVISDTQQLSSVDDEYRYALIGLFIHTLNTEHFKDVQDDQLMLGLFDAIARLSGQSGNSNTTPNVLGFNHSSPVATDRDYLVDSLQNVIDSQRRAEAPDHIVMNLIGEGIAQICLQETSESSSHHSLGNNVASSNQSPISSNLSLRSESQHPISISIELGNSQQHNTAPAAPAGPVYQYHSEIVGIETRISQNQAALDGYYSQLSEIMSSEQTATRTSRSSSPHRRRSESRESPLAVMTDTDWRLSPEVDGIRSQSQTGEGMNLRHLQARSQLSVVQLYTWMRETARDCLWQMERSFFDDMASRVLWQLSPGQVREYLNAQPFGSLQLEEANEISSYLNTLPPASIEMSTWMHLVRAAPGVNLPHAQETEPIPRQTSNADFNLESNTRNEVERRPNDPLSLTRLAPQQTGDSGYFSSDQSADLNNLIPNNGEDADILEPDAEGGQLSLSEDIASDDGETIRGRQFYLFIKPFLEPPSLIEIRETTTQAILAAYDSYFPRQPVIHNITIRNYDGEDDAYMILHIR
jgi:hypothetical protein